MDNLLYFPNISIPKTPWLYKSLLYWDTIDTITPERFLRKPCSFDGQYMRDLLEAELVRPVMPMNYIHDIPDFKEGFLNYVDSEYEIKKETYKRKDGKLTNTSRIHLEKMDEIGFELEKRELAFRKDGWFFMHQSVANDFMFYLATLIGQIRESQPITDSMMHIKTRMPIGNQKQKNFINRDGIRGKLLDSIFPTPLEIANVHELSHFKKENENQLKAFRKYIENELLNIDAVPEHLKDEKLEYFIKNIEDEKCSIADKMKAKWKVIDFATIAQIGGSSITMANAYFNGNNLVQAAAALSLTGAIVTTRNKIRNNRQDILNNPLAYAYIVDKKWGGKK
ncbi:TPA: hypothetical protein ACGW48_004545 [Bacillus paranthracis]